MLNMQEENNNLIIVKKFGNSLDQDDFKMTASFLASNCSYRIGDTELKGPAEITGSYEQNMLEGRKKLDKLEWGQSAIEPINAKEFYVHFTDYLTHKGETYIHKCKQKIIFNELNLIIKIIHIDDPIEQNKLNDYYKRVGLK